MEKSKRLAKVRFALPSIFRDFVAPLLMLIFSPILCNNICWLIDDHEGDLSSAYSSIVADVSVSPSLMLRNYFVPEASKGYAVLSVFFFSCLTLSWLLSGEKFYGPPTNTCHRPLYYGNGLIFWFCMLAGYFAGSEYVFSLYKLSAIAENYADIMKALNVIALILCVLLYLKGIYFPSSSDCELSSILQKDFYAGVELHPNVFGFDVKQMTNSRFGMAWWGISVISFAAMQFKLYGEVSLAMQISCILQLAYLTKFFYWEKGYCFSIDMKHDKAGYYICWGCLVWVPGVYTLPAHWLVRHPMNVTPLIYWLILSVGFLSIIMGLLVDKERENFRAAVTATSESSKAPFPREGDVCTLGKLKYLEAVYFNSQGVQQRAYLLVGGFFWGYANHLHYIPEILGALCWVPPVQREYFLPYFYLVFLILLLLDRANRDEEACSLKYGKFWKKYRSMVPYKIIPFVY